MTRTRAHALPIALAALLALVPAATASDGGAARGPG